VRYLFAALFLFVAISCDPSNEAGYSEPASLTRIKVDIDQARTLKMSEFFSGITYFHLETPDNTPIGRIEKITVRDPYIALYDRQKASVWIFTKDGDYVNEINIPPGRGPGELEHLQDAFFGEDHLIHVMGAFKLLVFDLNGNVVGENNIDYMVYNFYYDPDSELYFGNAGSILNANIPPQHKSRRLFAFRKDGSVQASYLPIEKMKQGIDFSVPNYFPEFRDQVYYFEHLSDTVYTLEGTDLTPVYYLDFGRYKIPAEVFSRRTNYSKEIWQWVEFVENELKGKYIVYKHNFELTNEFIYFKINTGEEGYVVFYDRNSNNIHIGRNNLVNDIDYGYSPFFYLSSDSSLYSYVEANSFLRHMNNIYENEPEKYDSPKMHRLRELAQRLGESHNPILMRLDFK